LAEEEIDYVESLEFLPLSFLEFPRYCVPASQELTKERGVLGNRTTLATITDVACSTIIGSCCIDGNE
jgi:hypothetical protein